MLDPLRTAHSAAGMAADYLAEARVAAAAGRQAGFCTERAADLLRQALAALASPSAPSPPATFAVATRADLVAPHEPEPEAA